MAGLGAETRFTVRVDRRLGAEGLRFAFRWLPAGRRVLRRWRTASAVMAVGGVCVVPLATANGAPIGEAIAFGCWFLLTAVGLLVISSPRTRAWSWARWSFKDSPASVDLSIVFDPSGYGLSEPGASTYVEWAMLGAVVEGDEHLALGIGRAIGRSIPIGPLTEAERTTIRRWVEAVPNGPRWIVRRSGRASTRLRVSPSPTPSAGDDSAAAMASVSDGGDVATSSAPG